MYTRKRKHGGHVNDPLNAQGRTALYKAAMDGNLEKMNEFLAAGADVNKATKIGTPLYIAAEKGHLPIVDRLLQVDGIDVNKASEYGITPLMIAALNEHLPVIDRLLQVEGIDVNKTDYEGKTALFIAAKSGHLPIVDRLLQVEGIDVNKADQNRITPLVIAAFMLYLPIVDRLLQVDGIDVNKADDDGATPLYIAADNGLLPIVDRLLQVDGIDVNKANNEGKTPYDIATEMGYVEIANLIASKRIVSSNAESKWEGWTKGDAEKLDGIFADEKTAKNFALCPVCMKYIVRSDACMYMSHNCVAEKGYYHKALYQKYKNGDGKIFWCTYCGRICKGHRHYALSAAISSVPHLLPNKDPFASNCYGEGGGDIPEKLLRFRRLREHARDLQDQVGLITEEKAMNELCEEMWNAPIVRSVALKTMQETKRWNIPSNTFPVKKANAANAETEAPNIPYTGPLPVVHSVETAAFTNATLVSEKDIIQFQHMRSNGALNNHSGEGEQISRLGFVGWLHELLAAPSESLGYCWQYIPSENRVGKTEEQLTAEHHCDAKLHPEEVKTALDLTDARQAQLYRNYKLQFNRKEAGMLGGRRTRRTLRKKRV